MLKNMSKNDGVIYTNVTFELSDLLIPAIIIHNLQDIITLNKNDYYLIDFKNEVLTVVKYNNGILKNVLEYNVSNLTDYYRLDIADTINQYFNYIFKESTEEILYITDDRTISSDINYYDEINKKRR